MSHEYMTQGKKPGRIEFFSITHKRKDGNFINEVAQGVVEKTTNIVAKRVATLEDPSANDIEDEVFTSVLGEDQYGRVTGYGLGVTPTQLFGPLHQRRRTSQFKVDRLQQQMQNMHANYEAKIENMKKDYEEKLNSITKEMDIFRTEMLKFQKMFHSLKIVDIDEVRRPLAIDVVVHWTQYDSSKQVNQLLMLPRK